MSPMDAWVKKIGSNRGRPRIFLDGVQAVRAGFSPGECFDVEVDGQRVTLVKKDDGSRVVTGRVRNGRVHPVIDINSAELLKIFDGMDSVRIVVTHKAVFILPLASEVKRVERLDRLRNKIQQAMPLLTGSLSHGGGVLSHAIHQGMHDAGLSCTLALANEISEDFVVQAIEHNSLWDESTMALAMPMQELVQDEWVMSQLPKVELLEMGLPCSGASKAGKAKKSLEMMESHEHVGHLVASAIAIINKVQPAVVLLENVVDYSTSASAHILRHTLRDMGYDTHEAVLSGKDFGALEDRIRWCCIGVTKGVPFDMADIAPVARLVRTVGDVLDESIGPEDERWRAVQYLKDKRQRDDGKGSRFLLQFLTAESTQVPTLRKGYNKGGSTDPRLMHPSNPELSRLLTPEEHARVKGVPVELIASMPETTAHQLLGQGIVYEPFRAVGQRIAECVMAYALHEDFDEAGDDSDDDVMRPRICG